MADVGHPRKRTLECSAHRMAPTQAGPLLKEFEKKYGIKTELWLSICCLDTT